MKTMVRKILSLKRLGPHHSVREYSNNSSFLLMDRDRSSLQIVGDQPRQSPFNATLVPLLHSTGLQYLVTRMIPAVLPGVTELSSFTLKVTSSMSKVVRLCVQKVASPIFTQYGDNRFHETLGSEEDGQNITKLLLIGIFALRRGNVSRRC